MGEPGLHNLTSGRILARNTVFNFIGQIAPMIVAVFTIPVLIKELGTDRFGVLTLAWTVIGYFTLFDLGAGQALTKLFAEKLGIGQEQELPALFWTALLFMLIFGFIGALAAYLLSPWLTNHLLKIPEELRSETLHSFYLLAFFVPIAISTAGLRGILEAHQRFDLINAVRIPMRISTYLGPFIIVPFSKNLFPIVTVLIASELIAGLVHLLLCFYIMPALRQGIVIQRALVLPLLRFGSWMTISNIISPLIVTVDRFLLGTLISSAAVAYYATPYEMVTKLWAIPSSVVSVLFPAFSSCFYINRKRTVKLFDRGIKFVFMALFPITLVVMTLGHEGLNLWLGGDFAENSTPVLQWLVLGVFINSLGRIASALVQSAGRPDITAKLHLIEVPIYLITFWWLVSAKGIEGAAIAWVVRVAIDTLFLFAMTKRLLKIRRAIIWRPVIIKAVALLTLAIASLLADFTVRVLFLLVTLVMFALFSWNYILDETDKKRVCAVFTGFTG